MKTIGIIGAGISGLVTAKTLKEHGFNVIVFEKESEVGGVWARSKRYPGIITQNTKDTYAFSDFPMPKHYPEWPSGAQVQAYLEAYARHFKILSKIRFNSTVKNIKQTNRGWTIEAENTGKNSTKTEVDFLTICNGVHNIPNIPVHKNAGTFRSNGGEIYHSSQISENAEDFRGKNVVVVGYAKSACDIANALSEIAENVHLVFRRTYWKVPMKFFGFLNYKYLLMNRLGEALFPYPKMFAPEKFLHGKGKPILNMIWKSLGLLFRKQNKLNKLNLIPDHPVQHLGNEKLSLTTPGFYKKLDKGLIQPHHTEIESFEPKGVKLKDNTFVKADVVIYATGWKQEIPFMESDVVNKIQNEKGQFQLYRNILPTDVPNLTFVGYNSSLCSQFTSEIAAHWTAQYIKGKLNLPTVQEMKNAIEERRIWAETRNPYFKAGSLATVVPFTYHYADELMEDMGLAVQRANPISEWLMPFDPGRYAGITEELKGKETILNSKKAEEFVLSLREKRA